MVFYEYVYTVLHVLYGIVCAYNYTSDSDLYMLKFLTGVFTSIAFKSYIRLFSRVVSSKIYLKSFKITSDNWYKVCSQSKYITYISRNCVFDNGRSWCRKNLVRDSAKREIFSFVSTHLPLYIYLLNLYLKPARIFYFSK